MKMKINNVRLSFPSLFHKARFNGEETKYEANFLIPKDSEQAKTIKDAIDNLLKVDLKGAKLGPDKLCIKDGDDLKYDGHAGHWSLKASNAKRFLVIDKDKTPLTEEDGRIYAGCYVNAIVELWAQNNAYGKRINATLMGVQFAKDGDAFGGGNRVTLDDFEEVDDDDNPFG